MSRKPTGKQLREYFESKQVCLSAEELSMRKQELAEILIERGCPPTVAAFNVFQMLPGEIAHYHQVATARFPRN